ncbi:MAG: extracellular solute-binding protein family 1 [Bacilli bacterium]|nr:extracellular solute-binding protein family 1 [Bacilli bacterium]
MKMSKYSKRLVTSLCLGLLLVVGIAGCGTSSQSGTSAGEPYKITIMTDSFNTDHTDAATSPVLKALDKYTNTSINIQWVPNSSYTDKMNITLASGNMPTVMLITDKTSSFVNAAKSGAFWDLTPYLKDYPNLSKSNPIVLNNSSIDGKTYGIYRARPLGRLAIVYRKDWLQNVGLQEPKTIDDFYNMLVAFKTKDPNKDGKGGTYGMVVTKYTGPWDIMQSWFGVPNKWGLDKNGKLIPAQLTPEYLDAVKFFRKLYQQQLINQDFAVMDPTKWNDPVTNNQAGVIVDVADRANGWVKANPNMQVAILGSVTGPKGLRTPATSGYAGFYVIPKQSVKTEADLKKVLAFLDKLNDKPAQELVSNGVLGVNYNVQDGAAVPVKDKDPDTNDLNQLLMYIPDSLATKTAQTPTSNLVTDIEKANEQIVVSNPAEPLLSNTYATKGTQLDNILDDARVKYIVGQIDDAGLQTAIDLWHKSGGDDYIKEINDAYAKVKHN